MFTNPLSFNRIQASGTKYRITRNENHAIVAAAGIVRIQAHTIFRAMPQRTALTR